MAVVSRPIAMAAGVGVLVIVYLWSTNSGAPSSPKIALHPATTQTATTTGDFTPEDYTASFDPPKNGSGLRNIFMPLLKNDTGPAADATSTTLKDTMHVPSALAGGDGNWIFTGYAELNGEKTGLLENRSTHKSEFVKEGAPWKATRVVRIGSGSVVFASSDGADVAVMRFDPVVAAKADAAKNPVDSAPKPLDPTPALQGPIGPTAGPPGPPNGVRVRRGQIPGMNLNMNGVVVVSGD